MNKIFGIIIAILLVFSCASAEVVYGGDDEAVEVSAMLLATQLNTAAVKYGRETDAINAALENDSYICVSTQQIMIEGLQGYTNADLRDAVIACGIMAQRDYCLAGTEETSLICPDFSEMGTFLEENEYELIIARTMDASNRDYVSCELCDAFYFDQELFFDDEEVLEYITEGAYVCVMSEKDASAVEELVVLGAVKEILDVDGDCIMVFATADSVAESATAAVNAVVSDENYVLAIGEFGYTLFDGSAISPADYTTVLFKEYLSYMTAEGLCFYEE